MPSLLFRRRAGAMLLGLAATAFGLSFMSVNPLRFIRDFHFVVDLVNQMLPPNLELLWRKSSIWSSLVQTVAMAFLATLGGALIAFLLALLAAANTTPSQAVRLA